MHDTILFTGHMIDAAESENVRFPAGKEDIVRKNVQMYLHRQKDVSKNLRGIAAAACGGDIIFHEVCIELDIPSQIYLALSLDEFRQISVSFAGRQWEKRFDDLCNALPVHFLPDYKAVDNVWMSANQWMFDHALQNGTANMELLALWNGEKNGKPGGTQHMIAIAKENNVSIEIIDIDEI
jgi:hypothetical protein